MDDSTCSFSPADPEGQIVVAKPNIRFRLGKTMCYIHEPMKGLDICGHIGIPFHNHWAEWRRGKHVVQYFLWKETDSHCLVLGVLEYWGRRQNIASITRGWSHNFEKNTHSKLHIDVQYTHRCVWKLSTCAFDDHFVFLFDRRNAIFPSHLIWAQITNGNLTT